MPFQTFSRPGGKGNTYSQGNRFSLFSITPLLHSLCLHH